MLGAFLLVAVFMNRPESSQQRPLNPTVRVMLHSKSRTVRAEETTVRVIKETFQDKKEDIFGFLIYAVLLISVSIRF